MEEEGGRTLDNQNHHFHHKKIPDIVILQLQLLVGTASEQHTSTSTLLRLQKQRDSVVECMLDP